MVPLTHHRPLKLLTEMLSALLLFLFVYTATTKLADWQRFRAALLSSPLLTNYASLLAWLVPAAEIGVATLLLHSRLRLQGLIGALILLVLFTGYTGYMLLTEAHLPCTCGGVFAFLSWPQHFILNCFLTGATTTGVILEYRHQVFIAINRRSPKPVEESRHLFHSNTKQ